MQLPRFRIRTLMIAVAVAGIAACLFAGAERLAAVRQPTHRLSMVIREGLGATMVIGVVLGVVHSAVSRRGRRDDPPTRQADTVD